MSKLIDLITNDYYKTLMIIYNNQITVDNKTYCPLSQEEIANKIGVSRNTMGAIIRNLRKENIIYCIEGQTKKYFLDESVISALKKINKI